MSGAEALRGMSRGTLWCLIGGALLVLSAFGSGSWTTGLLGTALLSGAAWILYSRARTARPLEPWPWPPDFRARAEAMARPIDPTPKRILPPEEKSAMIAAVATTAEGLKRLIDEKPPAWRYAAFTSILLQRRNGVAARLRQCVSGYQPHLGRTPRDGKSYSQLAYRTMNDLADEVAQLEQFMLSPAFTAVLGGPGDERQADPDAIVNIANRLMTYHQTFLTFAETSVQTPVQPEVRGLVADMNAFTLCPLMGYDSLIETLCARVGEAQDLLPHTTGGTAIALDDVSLAMSLPDGLTERIVAQIKRFSGT